MTLGRPAHPRVVILDDHITPYRIPLFESIGRRGVDLWVFYCVRSLRGPAWRVPTPSGYRFEILPSFVIRLRKRAFREPRTVLVNPTLPLRLLALRPDVVIAYAFSVPTWIAFAYSRIFGKAFISWSTDTAHTERDLGFLQRWIRRQIIPRADQCIAPSEAARQRYLSYQADPSRVHVAVQASALARSDPRPDAEGPSNGDSMSGSHSVVLYVGALSERKGVELLIQAFHSVRRGHPEAELVIVGSGEMETRLRSLAAADGLGSVVHFEGQVPYEELPKYYRGAALLVLPSLEDTYGMVVAEAAEFGLPIVVSKFAGAAGEFVQEGENGFVVDPTDTGSMASAILEVLGDGGRRIRMRDASIRISTTKAIDQSAQAFAEVIRRAALHGKRVG